MDAIKLLKADHRKVEELFEKFEALGERAHKSQAKIVAQICRELTLHAAIEERHLYPNAQVKIEEDLVLEAYEEHHVVKFLVEELETMSPEAERYAAKVTVLKEIVQHHVEEEETEFFPQLQKVLSKEQLEELGQRLEETRQELMSTAEKGLPRVSITMAKETAREKQPVQKRQR